jgi:hypothetical protein
LLLFGQITSLVARSRAKGADVFRWGLRGLCLDWPELTRFLSRHRQTHDQIMESLLEFGQAEELDGDGPVLKVQRQTVAIGWFAWLFRPKARTDHPNFRSKSSCSSSRSVVVTMFMLFNCIPCKAIHAAPKGIAKQVGKRSKYAARLCAEAIQAGKLKVPPTVKSYYNKNPGRLFFVLWVWLLFVLLRVRSLRFACGAENNGRHRCRMPTRWRCVVIVIVGVWWRDADPTIFGNWPFTDSVWCKLDDFAGEVCFLMSRLLFADRLPGKTDQIDVVAVSSGPRRAKQTAKTEIAVWSAARVRVHLCA